MRRLLSILLAPFLAVLAIAGASANPVQRDHVRVTLVSEVSSVRPGDSFWVALRQEIKPHWHTYWINPGDSGVPTTIAWTLPPGAEAGPIVWPAPIRFSLGHLVNFGYADEAWLLTEIKVPASVAPGVNFDVTANADWLACSEICVPEQASLTASVPLATETRENPDVAADFAKARAALPQQAPWPATYAATKDGFRLALAMPKDMAASVSDSFVFLEQLDAAENGAPQTRRATADGLVVDMQRGVLGVKSSEKLTGVVELTEGKGGGGQVHRFAFVANPAPAGAVIGSSEGEGSGPGLPLALLLAFTGGLILNLMPCVFPILSMKAVGLVRLADKERREARAHGLIFGAGVVLSFAVLAGVLIALRAGGTAVGWGFQLQAPWFVLLLSYLMFVLGLSLSGIYRIGGGFTGAGSALTAKPGKAGAFFTGVLAVLVATPCTAPFMGAALGFALAQPALPALAVFLALGAGMAAPYVLLSLSPALLRHLPKPGPWMERFRQLLAFPMYATAAWLVWVLAQQSPVSGIALALGGFILIGFAVWLARQMDGSCQAWRTAYAALAVVALGGALSTLHFVEASAAPKAAGRAVSMSDAEPWSTARVDALRAEGRPVLVNFTAAWCITCLVNEKAALSATSVQNVLKSKNVAYLKGDWTRQDPAITAALASFGRNGVPLYVLYPPKGEPIILPQILTERGLLEELNRI